VRGSAPMPKPLEGNCRHRNRPTWRVDGADPPPRPTENTIMATGNASPVALSRSSCRSRYFSRGRADWKRRNVRNSARAPGRRVARARGCSGCGVRAMHECRVVSPRHSHAVGRCNARSAVYAFVRASQLAQMAGCTRFHVIKRGWPGGVTQHRWTLSAARGTALEARLRRMAQRETTQGRISRVRENEAGAENYLRDRIWRSAKLTRVNPRRARSGRRCRNRAMPRTRGFARDAYRRTFLSWFTPGDKS
jgi:hypothetical protein